MAYNIYNAESLDVLAIGYQDENASTAFVFDFSDYTAQFGNGIPSLRVWRPNDRIGYLAPLVSIGGGLYLWVVGATDVAQIGAGTVQKFYRVGTVEKGSRWYNTTVAASVPLDQEAPEPYEAWYETLEDLANSALVKIGELENLDTVDKATLVAAINEVKASINAPKIIKRKDYVFEAWYPDIDYDNAYDYFRESGDIPVPPNCSAIRNGNYFGRNLDWNYNRTAEFVVHVPAIANRHASIGVSGGLTALTDEFVTSGTNSPLYKVVPFALYDGINDKGLAANMNVVPTDNGKNYVTPLLDQRVEIPASMIVRYILDNFETASSAAEFIRDHAAVYFSQAIHGMDYETHIMIADNSGDTYILEFVNGHTTVVEADRMTNFLLSGVSLNADGSVYTPETMDATHNAMSTNHITAHGAGLERWNLINDHYADAETEEGMRELLDALTYTRAYNTSDDVSDPYWYTEFVGGNLTCASPISAFAATVEAAGQAYADRSRDDNPATWQTVHSALYTFDTKTLHVIFQEDGEELEIKLETGGGGGTGTDDHSQLINRNLANQHTMAAITGLVEALAGKQATVADLDEIRNGAALGATALQTAPVSSVNGKTGAVNLVPADLGIGSVFQLRGSKPTYADLPASGNTIGDVWYVVADSVGYIWLNDGTTTRWEQLGMEIDLSAYRTASAQDAIDAQKQSKITASGLLKGNGSGGVTAAEEGVDYQTPISWDTVPTEDSTNGITSGAVFAAIGDIETSLDAINDGLEGLL